MPVEAERTLSTNGDLGGIVALTRAEPSASPSTPQQTSVISDMPLAQNAGSADFFARMDQFQRNLQNLARRANRKSGDTLSLAPTRPSLGSPSSVGRRAATAELAGDAAQPNTGGLARDSSMSRVNAALGRTSAETMETSRTFDEENIPSSARGLVARAGDVLISSRSSLLSNTVPTEVPVSAMPVEDAAAARTASPLHRSGVPVNDILVADLRAARGMSPLPDVEGAVAERIAELERKLARQQRDTERLAAANARLQLENGAMRASAERATRHETNSSRRPSKSSLRTSMSGSPLRSPDPETRVGFSPSEVARGPGRTSSASPYGTPPQTPLDASAAGLKGLFGSLTAEEASPSYRDRNIPNRISMSSKASSARGTPGGTANFGNRHRSDTFGNVVVASGPLEAETGMDGLVSRRASKTSVISRREDGLVSRRTSYTSVITRSEDRRNGTDVPAPWEQDAGLPPLARVWVPLCRQPGIDAGSDRVDDANIQICKKENLANTIYVDSKRERDADGAPLEPIDDNIFRRGTLWLWSRTMSTLDSDVAELLKEDYVDCRARFATKTSGDGRARQKLAVP